MSSNLSMNANGFELQQHQLPLSLHFIQFSKFLFRITLKMIDEINVRSS